MQQRLRMKRSRQGNSIEAGKSIAANTSQIIATLGFLLYKHYPRTALHVKHATVKQHIDSHKLTKKDFTEDDDQQLLKILPRSKLGWNSLDPKFLFCFLFLGILDTLK